MQAYNVLITVFKRAVHFGSGKNQFIYHNACIFHNLLQIKFCTQQNGWKRNALLCGHSQWELFWLPTDTNRKQHLVSQTVKAGSPAPAKSVSCQPPSSLLEISCQFLFLDNKLYQVLVCMKFIKLLCICIMLIQITLVSCSLLQYTEFLKRRCM